jgi:CBS domain-containing protein
MKKRIIPDVIAKPQELVLLSGETTVRDAVQVMATRRIGAVMIGEGQTLLGIFTERDLMTKVVAPGRDPNTVKLSEVMTGKPNTIKPEESVAHALQSMQRGGYRHLPVVENGRLIGMVSVRDLYAAMLAELEDELHDREAFIQGSAGYGMN